jgi:DNA-directed RNA polymerase subunit RPC12/RpoP
VTAALKTRYVDLSNPDLAVDCPRCGLKTARFVDQCRNCSYKLWPSSVMASAAFKAWRAADPVPRSRVSRFDMEYPVEADNTVDYDARAHQLGIHLSPNSNWPFVICLGLLFLALAAIPFADATRIALAVIGGVIFLWGVVGWVVIDDVRMFPSDDSTTGEEVHH